MLRRSHKTPANNVDTAPEFTENAGSPQSRPEHRLGLGLLTPSSAPAERLFQPLTVPRQAISERLKAPRLLLFLGEMSNATIHGCLERLSNQCVSGDAPRVRGDAESLDELLIELRGQDFDHGTTVRHWPDRSGNTLTPLLRQFSRP